MKRLLVVPLIVAAALVLLAGPALAAITTTITPANAPSGTHLQSGAIGCTVGAGLSVNCTTFQLAGVGNTNAVVLLSADYSATVDCRNHGGQVVESHTTDFTATSSATATSSKNGRLTVPAQSVSPASVGQVCPNPNWTPLIRGGTLVLDSFRYTLTFNNFTGAYITITGP